MTILLFGANGQVGWELRRTLAPLGPVRALERAEVDLANADAVGHAIRRANPSLIVNAAAYTAVDRAEQEEALALAINGTAPGVMAGEAKRLGIPLVHYSTDYVFAGTADGPQREDDATEPLNAYGRTKLAGEAAIRDAGCAHLILRTSWVYSMRGANFLLTVRRLAGELDELRIVADQIGAPTWARSIAEATALILARCGAPAETAVLKDKGGVYHMTAAGQTSWHGFAEAVVEWLRASGQSMRNERILGITTADYPTPAKRPANSVLDCSRLHETFGIAIPDWRGQLRLCVED